MNEDDATNFFTGRQPSFSFSKRGATQRGFRSRPGAPMAQPPRGLTSGSDAPTEPSMTPQSLWDSAFRNSVTGETPSSLAAQRAETGAAGPRGEGGIAGQTLAKAFGPGYWNRLVGRGPMAPGTPALDTPAPFMPRSPSTPFTVPKPLTDPMGNKASDRAALESNRSLYSPGGAQGLWGARFKPQEQWERPTLETAAAIASNPKYKRRVI